jgi:hypothetical protein
VLGCALDRLETAGLIERCGGPLPEVAAYLDRIMTL